MINWSPEVINLCFPVSGIVTYPGGIVIQRQSLLNYATVRHSHRRGAVTVITKKSLNRLAILIRSSGVQWSSVITLTYGVNYPHSGRVAKKHLNAFLVAARREFGQFEYFWVLEFQLRGAVHFHLATTLPVPDIFQRERFAEIWTRISQQGDWPYEHLISSEGAYQRGRLLYTRQACYSVHVNPKSWEAVREQDGMGRYLAKYANKLRQKTVPPWYRNVGRFWGVSKGVEMPQGEQMDGDEEHTRQILWLRGRSTEGWEVLPKIVLC